MKIIEIYKARILNLIRNNKIQSREIVGKRLLEIEKGKIIFFPERKP